MKRKLTSLLCTVALLAVLVGTAVYRSGPAPEIGPEATSPSDKDADEVALLERSYDARVQVTQELRAGRLTLFEAAARFQAINQQRPSHLAVPLETLFHGQSKGEQLCRQVIWFLWRTREEELHALADCFEAELVEYLAEHGTVCLPGCPDGE